MTQASHVSDSEKDLMYEGEVRGPWTPSELDVNNDDYFNHGRHWLDLADSAFLQGPRHNGKDRPPDWAVRDLKSVSGKPKKSAPWRASNQGEVKFHNATDGQVQIYWIDDEMGRRVHMRSLDSWMSYASSTSADQYWVAADNCGKRIGVYKTKSGFQRVMLRGSHPTPIPCPK